MAGVSRAWPQRPSGITLASRGRRTARTPGHRGGLSERGDDTLPPLPTLGCVPCTRLPPGLGMPMPKPRATDLQILDPSPADGHPADGASPPASRLLPRRGHGFPGSHGPPEQSVNSAWLTRRYRWPGAVLEKIPQFGYLARRTLSANPRCARNRQASPRAFSARRRWIVPNEPGPAPPAHRMPPHGIAKRTQRHTSALALAESERTQLAR
jgi:hypothetical protein